MNHNLSYSPCAIHSTLLSHRIDNGHMEKWTGIPDLHFAIPLFSLSIQYVSVRLYILFHFFIFFSFLFQFEEKWEYFAKAEWSDEQVWF